MTRSGNRPRPESRLVRVAAETVTIVRQGGYWAPPALWVDIAGAVGAAVAGTRLHPPEEHLPVAGFADREGPAGREGPADREDRPSPAPVVEVTLESTLSAGRRLGRGTAALVFASARNPGGGFRTGARAQEEDIARASALHACLASVPAFYAHHRAQPDPRYSDRVIYSPDVPVFRDDGGRLLNHPYGLSMITAAAPNLRAVRRNQPELAASVPGVLRGRVLRVLQVAAAYGHRRLVLGAWGCGVFGNDPTVVAAAFRRRAASRPLVRSGRVRRARPHARGGYLPCVRWHDWRAQHNHLRRGDHHDRQSGTRTISPSRGRGQRSRA